MPVLNRAALVAAIIGRRFPAASQTTNAQRWLDTAYQDVWTAEDWTFKQVSRDNFAVTAGVSTPTMPAAFADATKLYDQYGSQLEYLNQDDFEDVFAASLASSGAGPPPAYTVVNRQIHLGGAPGANATYKLSYRRRLAHKESNGVTITAGFMDEDDDYPLWDDHHAILIPRAQAIGLLEINDPTWEQAQQEYERQLTRMVDDYKVRVAADQWGRVNWYA